MQVTLMDVEIDVRLGHVTGYGVCCISSNLDQYL